MFWISLSDRPNTVGLDRGGPKSHWRGWNRSAWFLLAVVLMFTSALCVFSWLQAGFAISGWIGLPGHSAQIASAQTQAEWSARFAVILPFLAALVLALDSPNSPGTGVACSRFQSVWARLSERYVAQLIISVLGSAVFIALFVLFGLVFHRSHTLIPH
jgi:hypothetical protein